MSNHKFSVLIHLLAQNLIQPKEHFQYQVDITEPSLRLFPPQLSANEPRYTYILKISP